MCACMYICVYMHACLYTNTAFISVLSYIILIQEWYSISRYPAVNLWNAAMVSEVIKKGYFTLLSRLETGITNEHATNF